MSFQHLEILEKKPELIKREVRINFKKPVATIGESGPKIDGDDDLEEGELPEETIVPEVFGHAVNIVDRRKTSRIDRELILQKIMGVSSVKSMVKLEPKLPVIIEETTIVSKPTKLPQRLVLKQVPSKIEETFEEHEPLKKTVVVETPGAMKAYEVDEEDDAKLEKLNELMDTEKTKVPKLKIRVNATRNKGVPDKGTQDKGIVGEEPIDLTTAAIRGQQVKDLLPGEREKIIVKAPSYYMNNRRIFIQKLTELFKPYQKDLLSSEGTVSCDATRSDEFDLLTHQKIVRDYLNLYTPYRGLLLYHGLGSGKCLRFGTALLLSTGEIRKVEDIKVGDLLMGDDSKPRTVLSLARGRDKMYDIIPIKGEKYTVNQEHILCLKASGFPKLCRNNHKANTNYNIQWLENNKFCSKTFSFTNNEKMNNEEEMKMAAEAFFEKILSNPETNDNVYEVAVKDYLELSDKKKAFLKGYKVGVDFPEKELPMDPYMIGYWLGDGNSNCAAITSQDSTVLHYFANNLQKYNLALMYRDSYHYGITGNGKVGNNTFTQTLVNLNMLNNKHIPMLYKCNSRENRLKLLAGLLDSDGSYDKGGFEFTQKNETLMNDVVYLARSLGFSCYKSLKQTSWTHNGEKNYGTAWRININGNGIEEIPTQIPRKKAQPRKQIKDVLVSGINVEYVGVDDYYGFMLDGNCRFMLGDFTVTHNTCTSIAIAEGMKSNKRVFVLTPASLKMNFFSEMKKCGDDLYKKNQYWEFVSIDGQPEYVGILSKALSLSTEYIRKRGGAFLVNITKEANYKDMSTEDQQKLDEQLNEMIRSKYTDLNYNGLNMRRMELLTGNFSRNPFDNSVIVIDEAHNLISRIVNKLKKPKSIPFMLYDYLMNATNAKVVLLSGTPIINYPNEIGILYNILRGYIKTWNIPVSLQSAEKLNTDTILKMFDDGHLKTYDYVNYTDNMLTITRNPFGFVNVKKRGALKGTQKKVGQKGGATKSGATKSGATKSGATKKRKANKNTVTKKSLMNQIAEKLSFRKEHIDEDEDQDEVNRLDEENKNPYKGGSALAQVGGGEVFDRYNGVHLDEAGNISDSVFLDMVVSILKNKKNNLAVRDTAIDEKKYKALPDDPQEFMAMFVNPDAGEAININLFKRRILGLTSYFRSAQEDLLPSYVKTEQGDLYHIEKTEMSAHQFGAYVKIRKEEADKESSAKKRARKNIGNDKEELYTISSTYRIFSRAACNFAFPDAIERPMPNIKAEQEVTETEFDAVPKDQLQEADINYVPKDQDLTEEEQIISQTEELTYLKRIEKAMNDLDNKIEGTDQSEFLSKEAIGEYSPKFAKVLENLTDEENVGLHLLYSHFRTIEGIGIIRLMLLSNGFAEFKLQKMGDSWELIEKEEDAGKPRFVLYTGTETPEEKEIIRNVYNGAWDSVPMSIKNKIKATAENNNYGEIIKIMMITSSGAEGINLRNTRFVHVIEPYWHMVRTDQVIGRARRICSHQDLPEDMRTVKVFLYVTTFSEAQKTDDAIVGLRIHDVSRIDKKTPVTTDETLYEIASVKQKINNQILLAIKSSAVDCSLYSAVSARKPKKDEDETLVCYGSGKVESNDFISYPTLERDQAEKDELKQVTLQAVKITIGEVDYALNERTNELYNYESYQRANKLGTEPVLEGKLIKEGGRYKMIPV